MLSSSKEQKGATWQKEWRTVRSIRRVYSRCRSYEPHSLKEYMQVRSKCSIVSLLVIKISFIFSFRLKYILEEIEIGER